MSKPEYHAISLSGGKDSCALAIGMWERGYQIDEIIACDEGMWWPEAHEAVRKVEEITGIKVTVLTPPPEKNFEYLMFDHVITRGKRTGTKGYGWPTPMNRWCTTFCKARVIDAYVKKLMEDYDVIQYIGIAADEVERTKKEGGVLKLEKRFPLVDWGMTEADCLQFCYDHGITWNGLYNYYTRISCWCCPLMRIGDARNLYHHFPEKWEQLKDMDRRARNQFKANWSVEALEERFKREDEEAANA